MGSEAGVAGREVVMVKDCGHTGTGMTWFAVGEEEELRLCSRCYAVVTQPWHDKLRETSDALAEAQRERDEARVTRALLLSVVAMAAVGCFGELTEVTHDLEVVCIEQYHSHDGSSWARDIGISVDGRLAYSTLNVDWYWADDRSEIERFSDLWWALHDRAEAIYPTVFVETKPEKIGPNLPPCVAAKMAAEPCDGCDR